VRYHSGFGGFNFWQEQVNLSSGHIFLPDDLRDTPVNVSIMPYPSEARDVPVVSPLFNFIHRYPTMYFERQLRCCFCRAFNFATVSKGKLTKPLKRTTNGTEGILHHLVLASVIQNGSFIELGYVLRIR
jgi:hypothetical protein